MSELNINMSSRHLHGPTDITVLLPNPPEDQCPAEYYASGKKFPVLWLLHAGLGDRNDWLRYTRIAGLLLQRQVIAVMPNGLNSDFANHPQFGDGYQFADYFFEELMPYVQHWLPASAEPVDNFLAGVSMGSMGTWTLLMERPERFGGAAPLSGTPRDFSYLEPYRAMTASEFRKLAAQDPKAFPASYGNPRHGIWPKEINMICKYPTVGEFMDSIENCWRLFEQAAQQGRLPDKMYMVGGAKDQKLTQFKERSDELGMNVHCEFVDGGGHGYAFWDSFLPNMLDYFGLQ